MDRIYNPDRVNDDRRWTEGNPDQDIEATPIAAKYMNDLQEEVCKVIEGFGVALDSTKQDQLFQVIKSAVRTASGAVGDIEWATNVATSVVLPAAPSIVRGAGSVVGTGGVNQLWIEPGSNINATTLLGGQDEIYLRGAWTEYTKLPVSGTLIFTRLIGGLREIVFVSDGSLAIARDLLVFADGAVLTHNARDTIAADAGAPITAVVGHDPASTSLAGPPADTTRIKVGRPGCLLCNAATHQMALYPELAAKVGTTYGGDGVTTFAVPGQPWSFGSISAFIRYEPRSA